MSIHGSFSFLEGNVWVCAMVSYCGIEAVKGRMLCESMWGFTVRAEGWNGAGVRLWQRFGWVRTCHFESEIRPRHLPPQQLSAFTPSLSLSLPISLSKPMLFHISFCPFFGFWWSFPFFDVCVCWVSVDLWDVHLGQLFSCGVYSHHLAHDVIPIQWAGLDGFLISPCL